MIHSEATATAVRVVAADDPEWDAWIGSTEHDVFHTAAYHRVATFDGDGTALLAVYGSREQFVAWPYLLNAIPDSDHGIGSPAFDVTSAYGYSGPLAHGCDEDSGPFIGEALSAFRSTWRGQHVVSVFTRFHPILGNHRWFLEASGDGGESRLDLVRSGETVWIDLTKPDAQVLSEYARVLRQEIASSRRKGLITEIDHGWNHLPTFIELYEETMRRNHATDAYFLRREYFYDLIAELGEAVILGVTKLEDRIVAGCLFLSHRGILHPHLAGTSTTYLPMSPLKVMLDDIRLWGSQRGDRVMHLGGGRGGANDSLLSFKARFSPERRDFYTGRWILDQPRYDRLAAAHATMDDAPVDYFPVYRAPRSLD